MRSPKKLLLTLAAISLLAASAAVSVAGNRNVSPVQADPHGASYADWSARQWQWVFSLPTDHHPLFDTADISAGQSGHVWFLGGTFTLVGGTPGVTMGLADRTGTIPTGTWLFFPLVDAEDSAIEEGGNADESVLRAVAKANADAVDPDSLFCEIDGVPLADLGDLRVQSPVYTVGPLPDNNILEYFGVLAPAGVSSPAVSDGYFVMLPPLSAGEHTIHFGGRAVFADESVFIEDITYHLTVGGK
jgi:hypothetical protein